MIGRDAATVTDLFAHRPVAELDRAACATHPSRSAGLSLLEWVPAVNRATLPILPQMVGGAAHATRQAA
jgi:hypothetical protein